MIACKNKPDQDKDYQKQNYTLPSTTSIQYNPSYNRLVPESNSIDEVIQSSPANEHYQKRIGPCRQVYDLSQPIWFEEIMKKLAADEAEKKKKPDTPRQPEYHLN